MEAYFCHGIKNTCNVLSNNSEFVSCKYCMRNKLGSARCKLRILSYILTFFAACRFASLNCEKINSDTMSELQDRNSQF